MNFIKRIFLKWKQEEIQKQAEEKIKEFEKSLEGKIKNESIAFHNWVSLRYLKYKHGEHFNENGSYMDSWDLWRVYSNQPEKRNTYLVHASDEIKNKNV